MLAQTWYVLSTTEVGRHVEIEATKEITEMAFCYYSYSVDES